MKSVQRWISVLVVAAAALAGSFLFNLAIHRDAAARDGNAPQGAPKWQISAVTTGPNNFAVFLVNQETGEVYKHSTNSDGFVRIAAPPK